MILLILDHETNWFTTFFLFQILVTKPDFQNEHSRENLRETITELLKLNIIPIVNANDAVAPPPEADMDLAGVSVSHIRSLGHGF